MDIVTHLKKDHQGLKKIIKTVKKKSTTYSQKRALYKDLAMLVTAHAKAEEKVLYLPSQEEEKLKDFAFEGFEEHALVDELINEMKFVNDHNVWEAKLTVVCELLEHHLQEEEEEMFPKVQKTFTLDERKLMAEEYRTIFSQLFESLRRAGKTEKRRYESVIQQ